MTSSPSCSHLASLTAPPPGVVVHREECTQCFDNQDGPNGVDVCLTCFNGSCHDPQDSLHNHSSIHYEKTSHPIIVNIKRIPKIRQDDERPKKLTKLEIVADEPEYERYDWQTTVTCHECGEIPQTTGNLPEIIPAVLTAQTMARQSDIQAFSFDLQSCEHALLLQQTPHTTSQEEMSRRLSHCNKCDLQQNLWLCLECGNVACGRKQYGGEGLPGNGHALEHYTTTQHAVAIKLGSITAEGKADIYCYQHDEEIIDPEIQTHLAHWGINLADVVVTEKSLAEMQLDLQYKYSFNMSSGTGEPLTPVFGPGLTGLQNLGNSCYVASVIQALFSIPEWQKRFGTAFELHHPECPVEYSGEGKGACLECQMAKVCNGLVSGRYSTKKVTLHPDGGQEESQPGISPRMLKTLIGKGHAEFAGVKQQDAQEFLLWLLSRIQREGKPTGKVEQNLIQAEKNEMNDEGGGGYVDPTKVFKFGVQQRIQCLGCGYVKYRVDEQDNFNIPVPDRLKRPATPAAALVDAPIDDAPIDPAPKTSEPAPPEYEPVNFEDCVKTFTAEQVIELSCSNCHHNRATLENGFITLPDVLIITASRFVLKNWVPTKLDVPLIVPELPIPFTTVPRGLQPGERPLPEVVPALPPLHAQSYAQLQEMGFPANRAEKALRETGNNDVDVAMQWLFQHMEDPEIDLPYNLSTPSAVDPEKVTNLVGMGFDEPTVKKALQETSGDMERAVDWLFSHPAVAETFDTNTNAKPVTGEVAGYSASAGYKLQSVVMHKGSSVHAGHYVAFIRKEIPGVGEDWVLFNDEKVVRGGDWEEVYKTGYVYLFRRV